MPLPNASILRHLQYCRYGRQNSSIYIIGIGNIHGASWHRKWEPAGKRRATACPVRRNEIAAMRPQDALCNCQP